MNITPPTKYMPRFVIIDGGSRGALAQYRKYPYLFKKVSARKKIVAKPTIESILKLAIKLVGKL